MKVLDSDLSISPSNTMMKLHNTVPRSQSTFRLDGGGGGILQGRIQNLQLNKGQGGLQHQHLVVFTDLVCEISSPQLILFLKCPMDRHTENIGGGGMERWIGGEEDSGSRGRGGEGERGRYIFQPLE
ncbi:hypothetical protein J6590_095649 [Homalodisca vitripennis]|nr:hypothetical protein J6590_095649 [Homalodisca vitripennis]